MPTDNDMADDAVVFMDSYSAIIDYVVTYPNQTELGTTARATCQQPPLLTARVRAPQTNRPRV